MNKILYFDGDCDFCENLANFLQSRIITDTVEFRSFRNFSHEELLEVHPELTIGKLESEIQLIVNSKRYPGFFAIRNIFPNLRGFRYITPLLYLPLVPFLGMFVMYILKKFKTNS